MKELRRDISKQNGTYLECGELSTTISTSLKMAKRNLKTDFVVGPTIRYLGYAIKFLPAKQQITDLLEATF